MKKITCLILLLASLACTPDNPSRPLVFVLAGQSNMRGSGRIAELDSALQKMPDHVRFYLHGRPARWDTLETFGPEIGFAHELAKKIPDRPIVMHKHAIGAVSLLAWAPDWSPERADETENRAAGPLYRRFLDFIRSVPAADSSTVEAILWMQGERDARYASAAEQYSENLADLVQAFRRDLHSPDALFLLGRINPPADRFVRLQEVRQAQTAAPGRLAHTLVIPTDGLSKLADDIHYDTAGQLELGRRFARAYMQRVQP